jgi:hypothetical protein
MTRQLIAAAIAAASIIAATPRVAAQTPTLTTVLDRAAAYVSEFHRKLSSIVAEERYVQDWASVSGDRRHEVTPLAHRVLLSDLLLVKPGDARAWMEFRDVFEVDGTPVHEHDQRLVKLFLEPSPSTDDQIRQILEESARYNVGDVQRNINTPIFPLLFLEAANHYRFKYTLATDRTPAVAGGAAPAEAAFRVSTEVWVINYAEKESHTMIRTDGEKDLPSKGRFWIDPDSGQVRMSELRAENREIRATIDVSYQSAPLLGLLVPTEMRERYVAKRHGTVIDGHATYGRFRQFRVNVDEKILLKK